jgi:hypothetical protein
MTTSVKVLIGAIVTALGVAGLAYSLPILSNAAANKQMILLEAQVQKMPQGMTVYIPIVLGSMGVLVVGIALLSIGASESLVPPRRTTPDLGESASQDRDSRTSEAA